MERHRIRHSTLVIRAPLPDHISGTGEGLINRKKPGYKRIYCSRGSNNMASRNAPNERLCDHGCERKEKLINYVITFLV
jgi:hypothetical protein